MAAGHTSTEPRAHLLRRAVELLVAGPVPDDGAGLSAPLPPTTTVHAVEVSGTTAHVDLSAEVVRDRTLVGASAAHELLALAALANTLTEFPDIDHVELAIDGRRHGVVDGVDVEAFWGWWGLPARLARDASLVGPPPDGIALPDHSAFGTAPQSVAPGTPDGGDPPPVDVAAVRHEQRATTVRVSVELAAIGEELPATPAVRARPTAEGVLLEIEGVAAVDAAVATSLPLDAVPYTAVTIDDEAVEDGTGPVRVLVHGESDAFHLSTMTNPMRVVLDLRT